MKTLQAKRANEAEREEAENKRKRVREAEEAVSFTLLPHPALESAAEPDRSRLQCPTKYIRAAKQVNVALIKKYLSVKVLVQATERLVLSVRSSELSGEAIRNHKDKLAANTNWPINIGTDANATPSGKFTLNQDQSDQQQNPSASPSPSVSSPVEFYGLTDETTLEYIAYNMKAPPDEAKWIPRKERRVNLFYSVEEIGGISQPSMVQ